MKLLVIGSQRTNYYELFKGCVVDGKPVEVEHCTWDDLHLCSYGDQGGLVATITPSRYPQAGTPQDKKRSFSPDFVLLRAGCRGDARTDWRYKLSVLAHANIPTINSIESFFVSQDKGQLYGRLLAVKKRLGGFNKFPLVPQGCYSDWVAATFPPDFPCVAKVGTASGGLGKMKIPDGDVWDDFRSIMPMQEQFFATEPFISWDFDIRIQKIGNHYRAFRRTAKHWKSNDEDIQVEDRYKVWIDEAACELGMDICAMDVLQVSSNGKEFILECNSSAIGLNGRHQEEDDKHIRDLVLRKMNSVHELEKGKEKKRSAKNKEKIQEESSTLPSYQSLLTQVKELQQELKQLLEAKEAKEMDREKEKESDKEKKKEKKGFLSNLK